MGQVKGCLPGMGARVPSAGRRELLRGVKGVKFVLQKDPFARAVTF